MITAAGYPGCLMQVARLKLLLADWPVNKRGIVDADIQTVSLTNGVGSAVKL
mgnify:CR=1 FL=1